MVSSQIIKDVMAALLKHYRINASDEKVFVLRIDPVALKNQRTLLTLLLVSEGKNSSLDLEALEGIRTLLENIARQAHEWYGMNTLFLNEKQKKP
ncbi:hypothetical protein [Geobacter sp. DSM 9736]|uniref:hypothetical protein n=1 Tax=Geobacter sp. DSM 9736 TaxID=1277350 RepID=UPI000B5FAD58|nr:hypothetical protein [Geobacter sp. DSM 9736]SNB45493.1 hypothetical protein SAMN06269301_0910 [Geobacter sp. DSM 9736]